MRVIVHWKTWNRHFNLLQREQQLLTPQPCWRGRLKYPSHPTEAEVQFELYRGLKQLGYDARLEVQLRGRGRGCRLDITIFNHKRKPIRIIEVKKGKSPWRKQVTLYETNLGLPVDIIFGFKRAQSYLTYLAKHKEFPFWCNLAYLNKRREFGKANFVLRPNHR